MTRCAACWPTPASLQGEPLAIEGPLAIRLWPATRVADAPVAQPRELVV